MGKPLPPLAPPHSIMLQMTALQTILLTQKCNQGPIPRGCMGFHFVALGRIVNLFF